MIKKKKKKGVKYCPKCGKELKQKDQYCITCGYSFEKRKKKINLKNLILIIIAVIVVWVVIRILTKQSIIPQPIIDIFTNKTTG